MQCSVFNEFSALVI